MIAGLIEYFRALVRRDDGQTLVEYALIIMLISIALIASLGALGTGLAGIYDSFVAVFAGFNGGS
jgi:Flp pilus assembly pilin Flp